MPTASHLTRLVLAGGLFLLVACDSAEERAEAHYQEGLALLEAGDVDRALVEFRNVFKLDGLHREARRSYAEVEEERGNLQAAYGQYLRLVEQYPDDFPARRALLEIAIPLGNWPEIERHVQLASASEPEDPVVRLGQLVLDYRNAVNEENEEDQARLAEEAEALKATLPQNPVLFDVTIDYLVRNEEREAALREIEAALELRPEDLGLYRTRLVLLEQMGDVSEVEALLREMVDEGKDKYIIREA
jgi:tetratricopeptide (TPR) repeat protein